VIATAAAVLLAIVALGIPVAVALGMLGLILGDLYSFLPVSRAIGDIAWSASTDFILVAIPLFILLGEVLLRSGIAERMYAALSHWVSWLPGGLMHSNIAACALFAATSGSSVATAATIGTVALGEVEKHGYDERLFLGTLAAGGTLGILIPPSINMIVYGVLTDTSIPQLYLAGVIPGLVLAAVFSATVALVCLVRPAKGGRPIDSSWALRLRTLPDLVPPLLIFLVVIGSIYTGLATATESAALGVIAAFVLAGWRRRISLAMLRRVVEGTMRTTAMVMAILIVAYFLNFVITAIGLADAVTAFVSEVGLTPAQTLLSVILFYLVLGMFMETLSMMVATVPIVTPVVVAAGVDPVWFGVLLMLLLETAMITPPVGINLFVVQGLRPHGQLHDVIIGSIPFTAALLVMIVLLVLVPDLALWLPAALR